MFRTSLVGVGVCVLWVAAFVAESSAQSVVLASAEMGTPGRLGGTSVTPSQWVAWRFSTDLPLDVHHIGGHMLAIPEEPGDIFAGFVRLETTSSLPVGAPFNEDEVVATTTFRPNFPSDEYVTPFEATLLPGSYALVIGTGLFGATGYAALPNGPDHPDIPPTNLSSFIFWSVPRPGAPHEWRSNLASNMRLFIQANVIHLPGDYNLDGAVAADDYDVWSSSFDATGEQNADGSNNQIVDAADYTVWRDNLGNAISGGSGHALVVPEPAAVSLILIGIALIVMHFPVSIGRHSVCILSRNDLGRV